MPNVTQITAAFRNTYGRRPSREEIDYFQNRNFGAGDGIAQVVSELRTKPDTAEKRTFTPGMVSAAESAAMGGAPAPALPQTQGVPAQTNVQPSLSTSPIASPSYNTNPNFDTLASRYTAPATSAPGGTAPGFEGYKGPSTTPTGAQISAPGGSARSDGSTLEGLLGDVQTYVKELSDQARGDYDFVIKYLDRQHKMALGTDDANRAKFFESVANELENKIGRIPYDYLQKTDRERQDLGNIFRRNDQAQKQLKSSEDQFNEQQKFKAEEDQTKLNADMSSRGLLGSGIQQKESNKQILARRLFEQDPFNTDIASKREQLAQGLNESILGSNRNIEDITTGARRDSQDFVLGQDKTREQSGRDLTKTLANINREGADSERNVRSLWDQQNLYSKLGQ